MKQNLFIIKRGEHPQYLSGVSSSGEAWCSNVGNALLVTEQVVAQTLASLSNHRPVAMLYENPEPEKPKLVPWTYEDIPFPIIVRKGWTTSKWCLITIVTDTGVVVGNRETCSFKQLLENYEWRAVVETKETDWMPCGKTTT